MVPNTAVEDGDEDANYFQHLPYLEEFNETRGTHLVSVAGVHIEPMGIYAGRVSSLEDLPDGAVIAVPNDATNEGRALLLLQEQGLITLKEDVGLEPTKLDIAENPHNYEIVEMEAAQLPRSLSNCPIRSHTRRAASDRQSSRSLGSGRMGAMTYFISGP